MARKKSNIIKFVEASAKMSRQMERQAEKQRKALERQLKEQEKMQATERAALEVEVYENRIELLNTVHQESSSPYKWPELEKLEKPTEPEKDTTKSRIAEKNQKQYTPSFFDKALFRIKSKQRNLKWEYEKAINNENKAYAAQVAEFEDAVKEWETMTGLARKINSGDIEAYIEVIKTLKPFEELSHLGSNIEFQVLDAKTIEVTLETNTDEVIPKEIKALTKTGKLTVKNMPVSKFNEIYQDYVCGCILRIGRELFALLPVDVIAASVTSKMLNSATGHLEGQTIASAALMRKTFTTLNFETLDPSDSFANFNHNMKFKKTSGFSQVEKINLSELQLV